MPRTLTNISQPVYGEKLQLALDLIDSLSLPVLTLRLNGFSCDITKQWGYVDINLYTEEEGFEINIIIDIGDVLLVRQAGVFDIDIIEAFLIDLIGASLSLRF